MTTNWKTNRCQNSPWTTRMDLLHSILLAALTGFISALILSIPVGPVNLTILNEAARRGFVRGALIGLGATTMEVIYCFIAFTGFASFFTHGFIKEAMEVFSVGFMLFLGVKFMITKTVGQTLQLGTASGRLERQIDRRLHPHSAFMVGLVRVMANLGVFVFWVILAANFILRGWVTPDWPGKLACVGGVAFGTGLWFLSLSWLVSLGHGKFSERTLLRMEHFSGLTLLVVAVIHGAMILREMAPHKL